MSKTIIFIKYGVLALICTLLITSPFPYGSVENFWKNLIQLQCFIILFLISIINLIGNKKLFNLNNLPNRLILLFFLILIIQLIPMPEFILQMIASKNLNIWLENLAVLKSIDYADDTNFFTISLYPFESWKELLMIVSYFIFGYTVSIFCTSRKKCTLIVYIILTVSTIEAVIGIVQFIQLGDTSTGTYVSRTHFAGFLELTIFLMVGYLLSLTKNSFGLNFRKFEGRRNFSFSDNIFYQAVIIFLISLSVVALFLSGSRMGILSFLISLIAFFILLKNVSSERKPTTVILIFAGLVISGFIFFIGFFPIIERFSDSIKDASSKITVLKDSFRIIYDFPIFGTGLNTFKYIYPQYQSFFGLKTFHFTHNDYVQLAVETGIIGFSLLFFPLIIFLRNSLNNIISLFKEGEIFSSYLKLGAYCGIISLLIHSLADFNLHIPANAIYFALLVGLVSADIESDTSE